MYSAFNIHPKNGMRSLQFSYLPPSFIWILKPFCLQYKGYIMLPVIYFKILWKRQPDFIFVYMFIYLYIHTYIQVYFYIYIDMHTQTHICTHAHLIHEVVYTYTNTHIHIYICLSLCVFMHTEMHCRVGVCDVYLCIHLFWPMSWWQSVTLRGSIHFRAR